MVNLCFIFRILFVTPIRRRSILGLLLLTKEQFNMQSRIFATRKCQTRWQDVKPNSPVWQTPMFICDMIALSSVSQKNKIKAWISPSVAGDSHVKSTLSLSATPGWRRRRRPRAIMTDSYWQSPKRGTLLKKPALKCLVDLDAFQLQRRVTRDELHHDFMQGQGWH